MLSLIEFIEISVKISLFDLAEVISVIHHVVSGVETAESVVIVEGTNEGRIISEAVAQIQDSLAG